MSQVLTRKSLSRLKAIHALSRKYNGPAKQKHLSTLLSLAEKHIDEILLLRKHHNPHYLVEVGDLLVLCFEILLENDQDADDLMTECFGRYEQKLNQLILGGS